MNKSPFNFKLKKIDTNCIVYLINLKKITGKLKKEMDNELVSICIPNSNFKLETVKQAILDFIRSKNPSSGKASTITMGMITEFFNHLFLNSQGYNQEFQFFNLEEGSMKKGFDGVYYLNKKYWLLESKSTGRNVVTHKTNIKIAYNDLSGKVSGGAKNNPWFNAFNHIRAIDSNKKSLIKRIEQLSQDYYDKVYNKIDDFNIIPCSTIILEDNWMKIDVKQTIIDIKRELPNLKYKKMVVLCTNKKSLTHFKNYLTN